MGPVEFGLIIGGVVVIVCAIIVYIFLLHKPLMRRRASGQDKRAKKKQDHQKATGLASDLFQDMQNDARVRKEDKIIDEETGQKNLAQIIDARKNAHIVGDQQKEEVKPKKKKNPDDKTYDVMGQFGKQH